MWDFGALLVPVRTWFPRTIPNTFLFSPNSILLPYLATHPNHDAVKHAFVTIQYLGPSGEVHIGKLHTQWGCAFEDHQKGELPTLMLLTQPRHAWTSEVPKTMAQHPKLESIHGQYGVHSGIVEVQVHLLPSMVH